jgi:hypothetical protein
MIEKAIDALYEARLDIENWAGFASEEDRKRYDLAGHLARVDNDIAELKKLQDFLNAPMQTMAN